MGGVRFFAAVMSTPNAVVDALRWRYATKQFEPGKAIPDETWQALENALVLSPSSFGLQPWKFLVVENPAKREELVGASWGQRQVAEASLFVVFAVRHPVTAADARAFIERTAAVQGISIEDLAGFEKVIVGFLEGMPTADALRAWATRQVYIALGTFMTSAALLGVDTCPMEGIDPAAYDRMLGLEGSGYFTVAGCAVGYRHSEDKSAKRAKVRYAPEAVITHIL
jgi:nitroreductase